MKVIDLLNKIATGEEGPNKIFYDGNDYKLVEYGETTKLYQCLSEPYEPINIRTDRLNEEVGILIDAKIPEKLESYISCGWNGTCKDLKRTDLFDDLKKIGNKINEIIDYLEEKEC